MRRTRVERWYSDAERKEVHYYVFKTNRYIIGFNPEYISEKKVKKLIRKMKNKKDANRS